ncbi:MAG: hypothetical protein KDE06_05315 [Rhodobacteraceae bacterium]|nr:hypothetical protein [Paracoccaceae bacterium]MCB2158857.1 hypothetical protein [Paracoccaceae bacterium]MCP5354007.1 hypothetical protein [Paracoccaceae bacterium]
MSKSLAERAFELSYSQLRSQKEDLKSLRNQASFCAAVSGLVASVFVNIANGANRTVFVDDGGGFFGFSILGMLAILLFSLSVMFAAFVVIGWKNCIFDLNSDVFIHAKDHNRAEDEVFTQLASDSKKYFEDNEGVIDDAKCYLTNSLIFAWAQIVPWVALLT